MTLKDFCPAENEAVVRPLLDNAQIIKVVCQKTIKILYSDTDKENEPFESMYSIMPISSLDIVRKFLVL